MQPASALPGPYLLTSGVGNPDQVRRSVEEFMGRPPKEHLIFPDHHDYARRPDDARRLAAPGLPVICTAKDAVKLASLNLPALYALEVKADFYAAAWPSGTGGPDFATWWNLWWTGQSPRILTVRRTDFMNNVHSRSDGTAALPNSGFRARLRLRALPSWRTPIFAFGKNMLKCCKVIA